MTADTYIIDVVAPTVDVDVIASTVDVTLMPDPVFSVIVLKGPRGQPGPPGTGTRVNGETPTGATNGTNAVYTLADNYQSGTTAVYLNGLRETHYTETGLDTITFDDPPIAGDTINVDYLID